MLRIMLFALIALTAFGQQENPWVLLGSGFHLTADPTADPQGNVFFTDARRNRIMKIDPEGTITTWKEGSKGSHGIAYGPDGRLYAGQHDNKRIVGFGRDGTESVVAEGVQTHHLIVSPRGEIYFTVPPAHQVLVSDGKGNKRVVLEGLHWPRGVAVSADRRLAINDPPSKLIHIARMNEDGSLGDRRVFCTLRSGAGSDDPDPGGMIFDAAGSLYIATKIGVQVCSADGRLSEVIGLPGTEGLANVRFGGPKLGWLYVTDGEKMYRRRFEPVSKQ
jgi:gluconolactonase